MNTEEQLQHLEQLEKYWEENLRIDPYGDSELDVEVMSCFSHLRMVAQHGACKAQLIKILNDVGGECAPSLPMHEGVLLDYAPGEIEEAIQQMIRDEELSMQDDKLRLEKYLSAPNRARR